MNRSRRERDGYRFVLLGPSIAGRESMTVIRRIAEHAAVDKAVHVRVTLDPPSVREIDWH